MSAYVGPLKKRKFTSLPLGLRYEDMSELIADSVDELRRFARQLRDVPALIWTADMEPHCQIDKRQRADAVRLGAIECDEFELEEMRRFMAGRTRRRA